MKNGLLFLLLFLNSWVAAGQVREKVKSVESRLGEDACVLYPSEAPRWPVDTWYGVPEHVKQSASARAMLQFVADRLDFSVLGCGSVQGTIIVQFTVEVDGRITNPKIVRKLYPPLDEQVLRIVASFPRFVPGHQTSFQEDGTAVLRPAKIRFTLPVRIQAE